MAFLQGMYFLYLAIFIRYTEVRYYIFILAGNFLAIVVLILSIFGTQNYGDAVHDSLGFYYALMIIFIAGLYLIGTIIEIITKRDYIGRTLSYFYNKYLRCQ